MDKKAVGIVCEYNPFHNGHKHHIDQSLRETGADICVCAMSGDFTQRGEMALMDKWKRAEAAVKGGANLVVEIPTVFAVSNAGSYAGAGIEILEALDCDYISFGIEACSADSILSCSMLMKKNEDLIEDLVRKYKKEGLSYPKARAEAVKTLFSQTDYDEFSQADYLEIMQVMNYPNNVLAMEYIKNITKALPHPIKRLGYYDDLEPYSERIASASSIRDMIRRREIIGNFVPSSTIEAVTSYCEYVAAEHGSSNRPETGYGMSFLGSNEKLFKLICHECLIKEKEELNAVFGAEEGLGSLLYDNARSWKKYEDIVKALKSKAYTQTRIQRVLINLLLGITKEKFDNAKNYIRVLAFDEKGAEYLKLLKKEDSCTLPLLTNINKEASGFEDIRETLDIDILASDIYNLALGIDAYHNSDFVKFPLKICR